jgi:hypothetical protein
LKLSPVGTGSFCQRVSPSKTLAYCWRNASAVTLCSMACWISFSVGQMSFR